LIRQERPAALVLTAGRGNDRSALAAVRALATAGYRPVVGVSGGESLAAASRYAAATPALPLPGSHSFVDEVAACTTRFGAVAVFPSNDDALLALQPALDRFVDKSTMAGHAASAGLAVPDTRSFDSAADLVAAGADVQYPAVIKPARKQPGLPAYVAETPGDVRVGEHIGPVIAQRFLTGTTDAICGVMSDGRIVAHLQQEYARTWPRACGTASYAQVVEADPQRSSALQELLSGHDGIFQAQFVAGALIDLNLRVYGSMTLALAAGINLPALVCEQKTPRSADASPSSLGTRYRWLEGDLRGSWQSWRTGESSLGRVLADLTPRSDTAHSVVSLRDPKPVLARLNYAVSRHHEGPS
jgi:predicted ATP-grasp superfamily ATP-dependent carboligase